MWFSFCFSFFCFWGYLTGTNCHLEGQLLLTPQTLVHSCSHFPSSLSCSSLKTLPMTPPAPAAVLQLPIKLSSHSFNYHQCFRSYNPSTDSFLECAAQSHLKFTPCYSSLQAPVSPHLVCHRPPSTYTASIFFPRFCLSMAPALPSPKHLPSSSRAMHASQPLPHAHSLTG